MEPLLDVPAAAKLLSVDDETVRRLVRDKKLQAYKVRREYRFSLDQIREYLERVKVGFGTERDAESDE